MPNIRLQGTEDVAIELRAKSSLRISRGVLFGCLPGNDRDIKPEPRTSAGKIEFVVPAQKGATYVQMARVPKQDGVSSNQYRTVRVSPETSPPLPVPNG